MKNHYHPTLKTGKEKPVKPDKTNTGFETFQAGDDQLAGLGLVLENLGIEQTYGKSWITIAGRITIRLVPCKDTSCEWTDEF